MSDFCKRPVSMVSRWFESSTPKSLDVHSRLTGKTRIERRKRPEPAGNTDQIGLKGTPGTLAPACAWGDLLPLMTSWNHRH